MDTIYFYGQRLQNTLFPFHLNINHFWFSQRIGIKDWCIAWWHSGRDDSEDYYETEEPSDLGYATPVSIETPLQSSVSR